MESKKEEKVFQSWEGFTRIGDVGDKNFVGEEDDADMSFYDETKDECAALYDEFNDDVIYVECEEEEEIVEVNTMDDGCSSQISPPSETISEILSKEKISPEEARKVLEASRKFSGSDAVSFVKKCQFNREEILNNSDLLWKYNDVFMLSEFHLPREDIQCWDRDTECWYHENEVTRVHDDDIKHEFYPRHDESYILRGSPLKDYPVFELYSITINQLHRKRDFQLIFMCCNSTRGHPMIIYKRPKNMKAVLKKALPLKGPFRPPLPVDGIFISFTESNTWKNRWNCAPRMGHRSSSWLFVKQSGVIKHLCEDCSGNSIATVLYQTISSAVRAELTFKFIEVKDRKVHVKYGAITATDATYSDTQRIIQLYYKEEAPVSLSSGEILKVNRSEFGVAKESSYLRVKVELVYYIDGSSPDEEKMIKGYLDFKIPEVVSTQGLSLSASDGSGTFLIVETFWTCTTADLDC